MEKPMMGFSENDGAAAALVLGALATAQETKPKPSNGAACPIAGAGLP